MTSSYTDSIQGSPNGSPINTSVLAPGSGSLKGGERRASLRRSASIGEEAMGEAAAATASASSLGAGAEVSTAELAPSSGYRDPTAPGHIRRSSMRRQASISEEATSEMAFATAAALKAEETVAEAPS